MIPQQSLLLPTASDKLIASDGKAEIMMQTWMRIIQGRTGGTSGNINDADASLTAAGTSQATALAITNDISVFTSVPVNSGTILFSMQGGQQQWVFNQGTATLKIYPPVGGQIDSLGLNTPYSLNQKKAQVFTCSVSGLQFYSLQLG